MRWLHVLVLLLAPAALTAAVEPNRSNTAAPARWPFEQQVGTFLVHADYDITARGPLLGQLAHLKTELEQQLQIKIHDEQVHLILFAQHHNYRDYLRLYFPNIPDRQALFVKRRGPGMVFAYENKNMEVDLRHETTHALLNASLPYVPLWLDEGLAEYYEPPADRRAANGSHHRTVQLRALVGRVPDIEQLEDIGGVGEMGPAQYRDSWAWVHFLLHESDQSRNVLISFLRELQAHSPPGSLARRLAAEMPDYRKRYLKHFR